MHGSDAPQLFDAGIALAMLIVFVAVFVAIERHERTLAEHEAAETTRDQNSMPRRAGIPAS